MSDITDRLKQIKTRIDGSTPGPWRFAHLLDGIEARMLISGCGYHFGRSDDIQNGEFIAHARQDIPALVAALEVALEALREGETFASMNNYPEHEVRHTLCCEVPQLSLDAIAKIESLLSSGGGRCKR